MPVSRLFSLLPLFVVLNRPLMGQVTYLSDWDPPARPAPGLRRAPALVPVVARVPVAKRAPVYQPAVQMHSRVQAPVQRGAVVPAPQRMKAVLADCWRISRMGLTYKFGSMDPANGGLDCSGTVKHVLERNGWVKSPRTASEQYLWLRHNGSLHETSGGASAVRIFSNLKPGDLLFWRGTYVTNRYPDVSHVMIYLGRDVRTGMHQMFGASSSKRRGLHGSAVDVYEFNPVKPGRSEFIGYGTVPGAGR